MTYAVHLVVGNDIIPISDMYKGNKKDAIKFKIQQRPDFMYCGKLTSNQSAIQN